MRLLPKKELHVRQAQQKKAELDEGLKLARRIDSLREIAAQEEVSLASFRSKTLKSIQEEIDKLESERILVKKDVDDLRREKEEGLKQLDERDKVLQEKQKSLETLQENLNSGVYALKTLAAKIKEQTKQSNDYYNRAISVYRIVTEVRKETDARFVEVMSFVEQAKDRFNKVSLLADAVERDLRTRDIAVASKERDLTIREERLAKTTEELRKKAILLEDREQTLERELTRLKKYESNSTNKKR